MKLDNQLNKEDILPLNTRTCACGELIMPGEPQVLEEPRTTADKLYKKKGYLKGLPNLDLIRGLKYGFSTAKFGNMGYKYGDKQTVLNNRKNFAKTLGFNFKKAVFFKVVHGSNIVNVDLKDAGKGVLETESGLEAVDGVITFEKKLPLALSSGDCSPIIITDKGSKVLAMIHAGRGGTDLNIARAAVRKLVSLGFKAEDLVVGIGPSIQKNCYKLKSFRSKKPNLWMPWLGTSIKGAKIVIERDLEGYIIKAEKGNILVDVVGYNISQFIRAGIKPENIDVVPVCTVCMAKRGELFSHYLSGKYSKSRFYPESRFLAVAQLN